MSRALHMRRDRQVGEGLDLRVSLCGMLAVDMAGSAVEVTCRLCRRALAEAPARLGESEALGEERHVERGAHALTSVARRAIARSRVGEEAEGPRWRSLEAAYQHRARVVDDGAPVRSTSDPGRFGQRVRGAGGGTVRTPGGRDDVCELDLAEARATACVMTVGARDVGTDMQRAIMALRYAGRMVRVQTTGRKATLVQRVPMRVGDIAEAMGDGWTPHHVSLVVRRVTLAMAEDLVSRGVLEARELRRGGREKERTTMRIPGYDLDGWKEIADVLGVSEVTAQRKRAEGLPVHNVAGSGRVVANRSEVLAWASSRVQKAS